MPQPAVLIVNLGTPQAASAASVAEFLGEFLSDPYVVDYPGWLWQPILRGIILRSRPRRVAEMYRTIAGDGPLPLQAGTQAIADALQASLGASADVRPTYRYGRASVGSELRSVLRENGRDAVVIPLFPQRTSSSSETIVDWCLRIAETARARERVRIARIAPSDPGYISALADRLRVAASSCEHIVLSFHGVPRRYDRREGGRYTADCETTARALLDKTGIPAERATLSFQSRFGPEPWVGPSTFSTLRSLARNGTKSVAVIMPGFLTDGLETLEEIGVRARQVFLDAGGAHFETAAAIGPHPALIESLARTVLAGRPKQLHGEMAHAS